jgi:hypothetical protein
MGWNMYPDVRAIDAARARCTHGDIYLSPVTNEGKSRSPCIRGSRVRAPDPAKVLLSPDMSVWGLPASVAESVTVRHVRGYRGFVRFPLWHSLEISDCWGPLCSRVVDARVWVWQISDVTSGVTRSAQRISCHERYHRSTSLS